MHPTTRAARPAAALALALAAAVLGSSTALADPAEPTAATTTSTPTGTATGTVTGSPTARPTTAEPVTTTDPTGTAPSSTTTSPTTETSTGTTSGPSTVPTARPTTRRTTAAKVATAAEASEVPFRSKSSVRAALVPGDSLQRAGYAGGFVVRTLAVRDDHYTYPGSTFLDGGNTIDAVLALDGAGVGVDQADASVDYLADNIGGYIGTDFDSTYAGPTAKALLGVVAHGGDPTAFGGLDLVDELVATLGAVTPGRFSDLPVDCGFPPCDYSNTIGQALGVIALGRATGSVPDEAGDYLLAQQCADGGFRGSLGDAGTPCTSDLDATGFAAQALVGLLGADDPDTVRALTFLSGRQAANGGFLNQDGQDNANTAGVAAQAFAAGGFDAQLALAQEFLASLQLDCDAAVTLRGGIAFTAADRTTLEATPTDTGALDRALRATPQAALGLAGESLLTVTSEGAEASAPTLDCGTSTTTTSPTPSTTAGTGTGTGNGTGAGTGTGDADPASATPGSLAATGTEAPALAVLGAVLLVAGAAVLVLSRRRGAHR